jgi:phosphoenolpyruvate carboxykinase (ATP)
VPGTNPFFPRDMADMGNRMLELLDSRDLQVFVLNTGRIGGKDNETGKKVSIPYSSAMVEAIVSGTIEWVADDDFGYEVAASVPGIDDGEILQPRRLYERQGRLAEYDAVVSQMKQERRDYLTSFAGLDDTIVKSIG